MSTAGLQAIVEKLAISQTATDRQIKETDRQIKELGKQIGGLGNKFGSFAGGLSYGSIEKILRDDFGLNEFVTPAVKMRKEGREEEYDVLGKTFHGMIAYVSGHTDLKRQIVANGWYLAHVGDGIFELETPMGFQPKGYTSK